LKHGDEQLTKLFPNYSEVEIEAVRDFTNEFSSLGREKRHANLNHLKLWDESRKGFNERGKEVEAMLIGPRNGSQAEMSAIGRWNWGKQTREQRIALEQELLDLKLAWVTEHGFVHLNARGQMLTHEEYMRTR
jgi:hypothetical protein